LGGLKGRGKEKRKRGRGRAVSIRGGGKKKRGGKRMPCSADILRRKVGEIEERAP